MSSAKDARDDGRSGVILPLIAVCLTVLLGFVALAVDVGMVNVAKTQCQNAADAAAVAGHDDASIRADLLRVIEPIAGEVEVERYVPVKDASGHVVAYNAWVRR